MDGPLGNPRGAQTKDEPDWIGEVLQLADKRCDWPASGSNPSMYPSHFEPKNLSESEKVKRLLDGLQSEKNVARKLTCLKILVERFPLSTYKNIQQIAQNGSLPLEIRRRALWITGIMRRADSVVWLEAMLNNMEPQIREAAIDAIGFVLFPKFYDKFLQTGFRSANGVSIQGTVPIHVNSAFRMHAAKLESWNGITEMEAAQRLNGVGISQKNAIHNVGDDKLKDRIAAKLTRIMTQGRTQGERVAAARALGGFVPRKYQMRAAEWGVWIEAGGKLQLVKTVLDEIPPIAYQTTKQIAKLKERVNQIMVVTKPIIHLKVDRPMSVNVNAYLRRGQPWFYYPRPNDFDIQLQHSASERELSDNDFLNFKKLSEARDTQWVSFDQQACSGYPFLLPKSPIIGTYSGRFGASNRITTIGIRWQHLIVTPKQQPWMLEQHLDPKYEWWTQLRKVQSAWISNGFESEKFLYYDGPTLLNSPLKVIKPKTATGQLEIQYAGKNAGVSQLDLPAGDLEQPIGIMLEVRKGKVRGLKLDFQDISSLPKVDGNRHLMFNAKVPRSPKFQLDSKSARRVLRQMISEHNGLQPDEAEGLLQSWENQFFKTDGKRLIVRINRSHYDYQCPLEITPRPSKIARVGLILSELD